MAAEISFDDRGCSADLRELIEQLRKYSTLRTLHQSDWYGRNQGRLQQILSTAIRESCGGVAATPKNWLRCVSWNIEKGKKIREIIERFRSDSRLATADLVFLQEVDCGMARSGNRFVARDLARATRMNFAFAPCFIELTKGVGDDVDAPGDNVSGLQGNAILSKPPILSARNIRLPQCFEPFGFEEKRFGDRNALACQVEWERQKVTAVCTHLEVRNTPRCRARQMSALLSAIEGNSKGPVIIAGDFNSNTFARGTAWRTACSYLRFVMSGPEGMVRSTLSPELREPLFDVLRRAGFAWANFNDGLETGVTHLHSLEDLRFVPEVLHERVLRTLHKFGGGLPLRLDWIVGKNIFAAAEIGNSALQNETSEPAAPLTISIFQDGSRAQEVSDHRPILADLKCLDG